MGTIEDRIRQVIVRTLSLPVEPDQIRDDGRLYGPGGMLNSLNMVMILVGLEEEFGIEIPDEEFGVEWFGTVRAVANYVRSAIS